MEAAARSPFRRTPVEGLENPNEVPAELAHVWDWYLRLAARRRYDMGTRQHLSPTDLWSYFNLIGESPHRWEIDLIMRLDYLELSGGGE